MSMAIGNVSTALLDGLIVLGHQLQAQGSWLQVSLGMARRSPVHSLGWLTVACSTVRRGSRSDHSRPPAVVTIKSRCAGNQVLRGGSTSGCRDAAACRSGGCTAGPCAAAARAHAQCGGGTPAPRASGARGVRGCSLNNGWSAMLVARPARDVYATRCHVSRRLVPLLL